MKKIVCIFLSLGSAVMACNGEDTNTTKKGDQGLRAIAPRLSNAGWQRCCRTAEISTTCTKAITNRDEALELLIASDQNCIDAAVAAVEKHAREDLAAAYYVRAQRRNDPVDFLRALDASEKTLRQNRSSAAALFNRALAQETLGLEKEAIRSWDSVVKAERSDWANEAREHRDRLLHRPDPANQWRKLDDALRLKDRAALTKIARTFPSLTQRYFEETNVLDFQTSQLFADALLAGGEPYARAIVDAAMTTKDMNALEHGLRDFQRARMLERNLEFGDAAEGYERAAKLLERAKNPLHLAARYGSAASRYRLGGDSRSLLDEIAPIAASRGYHALSWRIHTLRANAFDQMGSYIEALRDYDRALGAANGDPTATVAALTRRSENYATIGALDYAFRDSFKALALLSGVADLNARHHAYAHAAMAARRLDYPAIALQYQDAVVAVIRKAVVDAPPRELATAKHHLAIALRVRADIHVELGHDADAQEDLEQASDLADAVGNPKLRTLLKMRVREVHGQALLKSSPAEAVAEFTEAIALATDENSTYRAVLYFKRAAARRKAGDARADEDIDAALTILRDEAKLLLDNRKRGEYESLWSPYFSRFQAMDHEMIESRIAENDSEGAFLYAEQARAFEPMQILLQSKSVPPGFRKIETKVDLRRLLNELPNDTIILQYLVLADKTYTWILSRGKIDLVQQRAATKDIEGWVADADSAVKSRQSDPFTRAMRAAYDELFRVPLSKVGAAPHRARIVIVPDGPMHGLSFAGLQSVRDGYLIERGSIAIAGSTSLYLYALRRDREFPSNQNPTVLVVGDPAFAPWLDLKRLPHANEEAMQLGRDYADAEVLIGAEATSQKFLQSAKKATIIHFAGHGIANPKSPWNSMLLLTPEGKDSGQLTAEKLMLELSVLERTRLVVLAACSTAGGLPVGPEGVAPLVRPLIAAKVPAVVGTLWDVQDATAKNLLVSLHCHYRNGDDVAVALRYAQLEMLRNHEPARTWAPFQVVGYAASPYAHHAALEETHSEHVCTQNSLHRPDGLYPQ